MADIGNVKTELHETEHRLLGELRVLRRGLRGRGEISASQLTAGQKIADTVAATMGSWRFIIIQIDHSADLDRRSTSPPM